MKKEKRGSVDGSHLKMTLHRSDTIPDDVGEGGVNDVEISLPTRSRRGTITLSAFSVRPSVLQGVEKSMGVADDFKSWSFDIFEFSRGVAGQKPLQHAMYLLLLKYEIPKELFISEENLVACVQAIEEGYLDCPYHNKIHAADVIVTLYFFLSQGRLAEELDLIDIFAALFAAAIHDFAHPGVNNAFEAMMVSPLAITYNNKSILENMSTAHGFKIMTAEGSDVMSNLPPESQKQVRDLLIELVLSTDMSSHNALVGRFQTRMTVAGGLTFENRADVVLILEMALHTADVSNPAKPLPIMLKWTQRVMDEFFAQGDRERSNGWPITNTMDRETTSTVKCQIGFINFVVKPLFGVWCGFIDHADVCIEELDKNLKYWQAENEKPGPYKFPATEAERAMRVSSKVLLASAKWKRLGASSKAMTRGDVRSITLCYFSLFLVHLI